MSLSAQDLARVEAAEASQERMHRLQRMSHYELRALLTGDPAEAAAWVTSAAEYGLPAAQLRLGRMLLQGLGVVASATAALYWFERAAEQLDGEAMNMVGRCHENGWGCRRNLVAALDWYRRSAQAGYFRGQFNYAALLCEHGFETDAAEWFGKAVETGTSEMRRTVLDTLSPLRHPKLAAVRRQLSGDGG
jgi:hypothetical protein